MEEERDSRQPTPPTPLSHEEEDEDENEFDEEVNYGGDVVDTDPLTATNDHDNNNDVPLSDYQLNRNTVRKLDFILLPFLALLFLLNSMDKANIGNAETAGFTHDAGLSHDDINLSMAFFYVVFVALQPISAALGRKFGMRRWVPACMTFWGLCTVLQILVHKRWQLVLLRVVIAMLEAGTYPTTVAYLSLFYTRFEFGRRLGFFYSMTALSGVLGGILSWGVFSEFPSDVETPPPPAQIRATSSPSEFKNWQILFIIEGCMTMVVALIGFVYLPASAGTAWFFNDQERAWAEDRILHDYDDMSEKSNGYKSLNQETAHTSIREETEEQQVSAQTHDGAANDESHRRLLDEIRGASVQRPMSVKSITGDSGLDRHDIVSAVFNYKIWHLLVINILSAIPATAFGVLLPILVKGLSPTLNLSPASSNLLSAPPFALGALLLFGFMTWSDRSRRRLLPILCGLCLLLIGLVIAVAAPVDNYGLRYASLCVLLSGSFIASPLTVTWLSNNTPEPGKRAILLGINGWGNLAGIFMLALFTPADKKAGYVLSFTVTLICVLISFCGFIAFWILLVRENKWRDKVMGAWNEDEKRREDLVGDMPAPQSYRERLSKRLGLDVWARKLGLEDARKGDDKLTYRYGL